ncbi:hypothetical protein R1flu_021481 [Riccia fluitans]|uniref:Uncharacterized protein n=1 Tax=Riccia fluitans TaxID=41844 RepID=A0ABD1ZPH6_9MARC
MSARWWEPSTSFVRIEDQVRKGGELPTCVLNFRFHVIPVAFCSSLIRLQCMVYSECSAFVLSRSRGILVEGRASLRMAGDRGKGGILNASGLRSVLGGDSRPGRDCAHSPGIGHVQLGARFSPLEFAH